MFEATNFSHRLHSSHVEIEAVQYYLLCSYDGIAALTIDRQKRDIIINKLIRNQGKYQAINLWVIDKSLVSHFLTNLLLLIL